VSGDRLGVFQRVGDLIQGQNCVGKCQRFGGGDIGFVPLFRILQQLPRRRHDVLRFDPVKWNRDRGLEDRICGLRGRRGPAKQHQDRGIEKTYLMSVSLGRLLAPPFTPDVADGLKSEVQMRLGAGLPLKPRCVTVGMCSGSTRLAGSLNTIRPASEPPRASARQPRHGSLKEICRMKPRSVYSSRALLLNGKSRFENVRRTRPTSVWRTGLSG